MNDPTLYDLVVQIMGEPQGEYGGYVVYVVTAFIFVFVVYMLLNLILSLFRWMWGS